MTTLQACSVLRDSHIAWMLRVIASFIMRDYCVTKRNDHTSLTLTWRRSSASFLTIATVRPTFPPVDGSGVYALFLARPSTLPLIAAASSSVLYFGMTESSLKVRNHFTHEHSGFSTLRRSLGALLQLHAMPRAPGPSKTNVTNFRFSSASEERLTRWIKEHLAYGFALLDQDIPGIERALIAELQPPLNLTAFGGWHNRHAAQSASGPE